MKHPENLENYLRINFEGFHQKLMLTSLVQEDNH